MAQSWLGDDDACFLDSNAVVSPAVDVLQMSNDDAPVDWEDAAVMVPCFTNCPSEYKGEKDAWRQMARVKSGVGIVDGVDKYTGETLEAIARRASEAAKKDAELGAVAGLAVDGSAVTEAGFVSRVEEVKSGGKCWSVDEERAVMGQVREGREQA